MTRRDKVTALILGRRKVGEADLVLTLFTRERGLLKVVAKGVRKIPSRRGGHVEPLTKVVVLLTGHFVAAVETVAGYSLLHRDRAAMQHAMVLSDLFRKLLPEEQPAEKLFTVLDDAWRLLPNLEPTRRSILEATVQLQVLHAAGLSPALRHCLSCGREQPQEAVVLRGDSGGWHCLSCHGQWAGARHSLSPALLKVLRWLHRYPEQALRLKSSSTQAEQLLAATRQYTSSVAYG